MPIYTKTGDKGTTRTFYGEMSKGDELAEALGSIDELNSWIGLIRSKTQDSRLKNIKIELKRIQGNLLIIGTVLAGSKAQRLKGAEVTHLEKLIDKLTGELPSLKNFIYPVGEIQIARAVCRRAERRVVQLQNSKSEILSSKQILNIIKYLNRLSDALFTIARWVNYKTGINEEVWK